jgi:LmbE family N-acetylglucosaminyl deacetylase
MKLLGRVILSLLVMVMPVRVIAQSPKAIKGPDERYKVDILVVVAHPDDEGFFTPYLARAINDLHKRVAVVFATRGGSGGDHFARERGPALANAREIEARDACTKLGISLVWFLDGKDTASQSPLDSLSNWGHGANLEKLVGLVRLTRPEVVFTHFPGIFIGENHGDHQATGILATEAFDQAASPVVFPSQLAGETKHYEVLLSNLETWQPKKIYYGSDAEDSKQFDGTGPAYSVKEVSAALKKPYWRIAMEAATPHRTQFSDEIDRIMKMSDAEVDKMMSDPNSAWWSEPATLIFGKSLVGGKPTDDVFARLGDKPGVAKPKDEVSCSNRVLTATSDGNSPRLELGGPWRFYEAFYPVHGLCGLPIAKVPEIGVKTGSTLVIPVVVLHGAGKPLTLSIAVKAPEGWKSSMDAGPVSLPAEESTPLSVHIETPTRTGDALKKAVTEEIVLRLEVEGKAVSELRLRVLLRATGLPQ